jgi:hypothetical protein
VLPPKNPVPSTATTSQSKLKYPQVSKASKDEETFEAMSHIATYILTNILVSVCRPRGAHDYYNTMWDPHVYRGDTFITFQEVKETYDL